MLGGLSDGWSGIMEAAHIMEGILAKVKVKQRSG